MPFKLRKAPKRPL